MAGTPALLTNVESEDCEPRSVRPESSYPLSQTWQGMGQASVTSSRLEEPGGSSSRRLSSEAGISQGNLEYIRSSLMLFPQLELSPLLAVLPTLHLGLSLNVTSLWLVTFLDSPFPSTPSW